MELKDFFSIKHKKENKSMWSFYYKYIANKLDDYTKSNDQTNLIAIDALDYQNHEIINYGAMYIYAPSFTSLLLVYQPKYKRMAKVFDNLIFVDDKLVGDLTKYSEYNNTLDYYNSLAWIKDYDFK